MAGYRQTDTHTCLEINTGLKVYISFANWSLMMGKHCLWEIKTSLWNWMGEEERDSFVYRYVRGQERVGE